ncbi:DUF2079 domain-containing protein [Porcipelethomonas sp.]|uniref:DUF2079 domain-containing protein n=1 Tax=Porcipelethomonas sp. TaxID=2981675 RepID=UPI003EF9229E
MDNKIENPSLSEPEDSTDNLAEEIVPDSSHQDEMINSADEEAAALEETDAQPEEEPKTPVWQIVKEWICHRGYEESIVRILIAWIAIAFYEMIKVEYSFTTFEFFPAVKIPVYIALILVVFVLLSIINRPKLDKCLLIAVTLAYGSYAIAQDNSFYFTIGGCVVMGIVCTYCVGSWIKVRLKKVPTILIVALLGIMFTLFTGILTSLKHLQHWSACYDFGIFSQMYEYMKETGLPLTTCERDKLLSHFAVHFSPVYYLILPIYILFPTPVTLLMCQAAVIASGLIPLYLLCRKYNLSNPAIVLFSICYVLLPSMSNGCFFFFHENKFLTPLILWLAYALEKNKWLPVIVCAILVMSVKEDAPVYVAVLGLYFLLSKRAPKKGIFLMVVAVIYFFTATYFINTYGEGTLNDRFSNFFYDGSDSFITIIKAVILNPMYTLYECFNEDRIKFFLQMLVPLGFIPFMIKKPSKLVLLIPFIMFNLMGDYSYLHDIGFQYTYGSAAFLFYLMVLNYSELKPGFRNKALAVAVASSIFMFMGNTYGRLDGIESYKNDKETIEKIDNALELIPKDSSVAVTTFLLPALYDVREIYEYETTSHRDSVEYIVLDLRYGSDSYSPDDYANNPNYETIINESGCVAIFRNVTVNS